MIKTKQDLKDYLVADYKCQPIKNKFAERFLWGENYYMFCYLKHLRYLEYYMNKRKRYWDYILYMYYLLRHRHDILKYDINIAPNTIGKGLNLTHPGFRRIGCYLRIGDNCTMLPMVLIGKSKPKVDVSEFTIGDNCYISTGAIIMGPVHIGNNVTIGAGAVVTKDIPDNAVVGGVPARIIKFKET